MCPTLLDAMGIPPCSNHLQGMSASYSFYAIHAIPWECSCSIQAGTRHWCFRKWALPLIPSRSLLLECALCLLSVDLLHKLPQGVGRRLEECPADVEIPSLWIFFIHLWIQPCLEQGGGLETCRDPFQPQLLSSVQQKMWISQRRSEVLNLKENPKCRHSPQNR